MHFVGIGGVGMSGIAEVMMNLGYHVTGSDIAESDTTRHLAEMGATIWLGHDASHVAGADAVVISSAVHEENPEVVEALQYRYRGILSPLCLPIPPHRQLSAMIRIPYSPVIVKHGQGKPFKFFRQLPLQKVQTGARFRAIFRPEAHILAENPNAKEEIK